VLWAAVLVPPVLRSRTESKRGGIGDLTSRLGAVTRRQSSSMGTSRGRQPLRAVPPPSGSARARSTERRRGAARAGRREMATARKRRRNVLLVLVGVAGVSLGLAALLNPLFWILHVLADVLLVAYLYLLFLVKRHGLMASGDEDFWSSAPGRRAPATVAHPRVPARPELAPMSGASKPRRTAAG
jgi:hypothetical protein